MSTTVLSALEISKAVSFFKKGEIVAFPTETVYGLGAPLFNEASIKKIYSVKGRPSDNPLIAHIFDHKQLFGMVINVPDLFHTLAKAFFPGPLTIILKKDPKVPLCATAGLDTLGVRMPDHPVALKLLEALGEPLVAPSANLSGRPSATEVKHVLEDFEGKIAAVLDGGRCCVGLESTVLSLIDPKNPIIYRPGAITKEQIEAVLHIRVTMASSNSNQKPLSPGIKYRHYAPNAKVLLFYTSQDLQTYLKKETCRKRLLLQQPTEPSSQSDEIFQLSSETLFRHLRFADERGCEEILVLCEEKILRNDALMNRLLKASQDFK
jgi:L-threonylcarbamoyladenylate synthase